MTATRRALVGVHLFNALSAVGGGIALIVGGLGVPTTLLRHTPFDSFFVPGIFLGAVIGGSAAIAATALLAHWRRALMISAAAGAIMVGWILAETLLVEGFSWLQGLYLITGSIAVLPSIRLSPGNNARPRTPDGIPGPRRPGGAPMKTAVRWFVVVVLVGHGLIHLLGAAKGLGWAEVGALPEPIGPAMGLAWLAAAVVVVATGVLLAVRNRGWWVAGSFGVVLSQAVILTSWNDAKAGTVANVLLLAALGYTFASRGPTSYRAQYQHRSEAALRESQAVPGALVTEAELAHLPGLVAGYVRRSGAVGQPHVSSVDARIHGRIRADANARWMTYTGEQVNTYGPEPSRTFLMDATMFGLPVAVLHVFAGPAASMRVKLCSLVPMVNAAGPEMDRAETVTLFNDLCILAPAAMIDAPILWKPIDANHVRGIFTNGPQTVTADLTFENGDLVDFVSDDRMKTSSDGATFTQQRWSTPVCDYRTFGARRNATHGEGRWHTSDPQGQYAYLEYNLDTITCNPARRPPRDEARYSRSFMGGTP